MFGGVLLLKKRVKGVPLWVFVVILVCIVLSATIAYVFQTVSFPVEVKEPLEVVNFPTSLEFYPNATQYFNITVQNVASVNYLVALEFMLNDTAYQQSYVTFSNITYTTAPGLNNLTAWMNVAADAPPAMLELAVEICRVLEEQPTFGHTFIFANETQNIVNGTLMMQLDFRLTEENLLITARINHTEYYSGTSLGLIIDQEFDGFRIGDQGYVFFADNKYYSGLETELRQPWYVQATMYVIPHPSPYHNCTFENETGYTFSIRLPRNIVPQKTSYYQNLRMHVDFVAGYNTFVEVEFSFENWPEGVPT